MSRVVAVAPVLPPNSYPQHEISAVIGPLLTDRRPGRGTAPEDADDDPGAAPTAARAPRRAALDRLHAASGVTTRHLALPLADYPDLDGFGAANDHFVRLGTEIAEQAARAALDQAGLEASEVDFLLFTSVTGISAPSIDALLVERLGMRTDLKRLPSFGLGCVGGAAGIARVHDYLAGHPRDVALLVSVELCSLTVQPGDDSTANLVSSGLFGDGAAAVVMVGEEHPRAGTAPSVVDTRSRLYPGTEDQLGWDIGASGFRIVLSAGLPEILGAHLEDDVAAFLEGHDLKVRDIGTWVVHAGGPRVLDAVARSLDLDDDALAVSRWSLDTAGNLSSASVLHVLAETLRRGGQEAGDTAVLMAFGPGVSAELVLLRWSGR